MASLLPLAKRGAVADLGEDAGIGPQSHPGLGGSRSANGLTGWGCLILPVPGAPRLTARAWAGCVTIKAKHGGGPVALTAPRRSHRSLSLAMGRGQLGG